jgi:polyphosphate kinase
VEMLVAEHEIEPLDVFRLEGPIDLTGLWPLVGLDRPELKDEPWKPRTPAVLQEDVEGIVDVFARIRAGDILVHHPYDSFSASVERFIQTAAVDPDVLSIKLTLYRTSGDSPVVKALIDATERGKQVAALVELKARFDEQANIVWARKLEEAGVHVVYGLVGLKTHTKVALVVRSEPDGLRRYCHVATGNYNSATARIYEDLGLFSALPSLGDDLIKLFNGLTGFARPVDYAHLVVAPTGMREKMLELINNELPTAERPPGRIILKMNSLVDQSVIEALYAASQSGVQIDLIIRGICCLRPEVPGLSDNIHVRSIVGRFLEHSRLWYFANGHGADSPAFFIGSADMMPRNLDRRIEAIVPILDPALQTRLKLQLDTLLADNVSAWQLSLTGEWTRVVRGEGTEALSAHSVFQRQAIERAGAASGGRGL